MINAKSPLRFLGAGFLNQSNKSLVINFFDKTGQFLSVLGIAHEKLAFTLPLISLRRRLDTEAAPHFVYQIRHNPLNRKNSFLLSAFLPRTKLPPARNASWPERSA
ncbi:MAG: hypothetical protein E7J63_00605 [Pantoea sp.]|uniref:hypothetical protein n=1 Tax=Pantoea sp. TaxID=69393 RepID=UPI00290F03D5|nr:hypothetical protein [Pantoea sp.]MDU7836800.1 hypothetical protein [Pantoea sp.]